MALLGQSFQGNAHRGRGAAGAVLAGGERPTVERVCQELGRGSMNEVGHLIIASERDCHLAFGRDTLETFSRHVVKVMAHVIKPAINVVQVRANRKRPSITFSSK